MKQQEVKKIWMVSREYGDLAGAGGVKDMVIQLAESLARLPRTAVRVVLPHYGFINPEEHRFSLLQDPLQNNRPLEFEVDMAYGREERREICRVWVRQMRKVKIYLIEAERFLEKTNVYTYTAEDSAIEEWKHNGMGHYDYFAMNVLLQKSSLELMILLGEKPDVIHCHDGHTALIPAMIHTCQGWRSYFNGTGCLVTIHNAGIGYHQEVADLPFAHSITGLDWQEISDNRLEGKFDPFLSAGSYAVINTVSENYAKELQESEEDLRTDWLGHTLLDRNVRIEGITNGITPAQFNPLDAKKLHLAAAFDPGNPGDKLEGKSACKKHMLALLAEGSMEDGVNQFGSLEGDSDEPLFTFIGRLSEQKGVDLFLIALEKFFMQHHTGQVLILGNGTELLEAQIVSLTEKSIMKGRVCFLRGYSPQVANMVFAAGDFFVIPSRFEPCGLTDYIAQLFGNIPIVHHVGGLVKVVDGKTGLCYTGEPEAPLTEALARALHIYADQPILRSMQLQAVRTIHRKHTWGTVVKQYLRLYKQAKRQRSGATGRSRKSEASRRP